MVGLKGIPTLLPKLATLAQINPKTEELLVTTLNSLLTFEYHIAEISERIFTFTELSEKRIGSMHPRNMHLR